jgi:DNA-binding IscR family transcriptional regulator
MQIMNGEGILGSSQGVKGGYKLARPLNSLNYLELLELVEQKKFDQNCSDINCSLIESCNITGPIQNLNKKLVQFFESITVSTLLEEHTDTETNNLNHLNDQGETNEYRTR